MIKFLILSFLVSFSASAETLISCHDGDTCKFSSGEGFIKVRFSGIDAPEIDQPFGEEARVQLTELLTGQNVSLQCDGHHGVRATCIVFVGDREIQKELVRGGLALDFPNHSGGRYKDDQEYAMQNKLGMWKSRVVYSPFCWRWKNSRECRADSLFQK